MIAMIWNQVRAMLGGVALEKYKRNKLWAEAFNNAVMVDSVVVKEGQGKCADEKWSGEVPRWVRNLKEFGEIGVIRNGKKKLKKIEEKGYTAMFIGYSEIHAGGVYKMMNLQT